MYFDCYALIFDVRAVAKNQIPIVTDEFKI